jgi:SOS regulatory protein LexA
MRVASAQQPWERSFDRARAAFKNESPVVSLVLFQALADAYRMAEYCHDRLLNIKRRPLPASSFEEWEHFLRALYNDTWKVYLKYSRRVRLEDAQTKLEELRDAASDALLKLQDVNPDRPTSKALRDALNELRRLVNVLEDAKEELGRVQRIREVDDMPAGFAAGETANVPLVGSIAAGVPILAQEFIEDTYSLPRQLVGDGNLFLLNVVGDSMIGAAITDGDWVVVRQQRMAENGEIVAALIEDEATVKTLRFADDGHVLLAPQNSDYSVIPGDGATILGKVVAVLRRL